MAKEKQLTSFFYTYHNLIYLESIKEKIDENPHQDYLIRQKED